MNNKLFKIFIKLDRIAAWLLLIIMILFAISGYGMTKGLIDPVLAQNLHLNWLTGIGLIAFVIHSSWAIHLAFKRWRIWNKFSQAGLISFYLITILFFTYVDQFYQKTSLATLDNSNEQIVLANETKPATTNTDLNLISAKTSGQNSNQNEKIFNAQELSKYNGLNGQPAYVAIDGLVYDMSSVFLSGYHAGYAAGLDQSAAFHSQHANNILQRFTIIGKYQP
jgi:predicted heme/steroid binding protein